MSALPSSEIVLKNLRLYLLSHGWFAIDHANTPDEYKKACDAHKDGKAIRIFGIPEKAGKFWTLTKAHDFVVL